MLYFVSNIHIHIISTRITLFLSSRIIIIFISNKVEAMDYFANRTVKCFSSIMWTLVKILLLFKL